MFVIIDYQGLDPLISCNNIPLFGDYELVVHGLASVSKVAVFGLGVESFLTVFSD
jgi:hypothetical protein